MADAWEQTGNINCAGLTNSLFDTPKQTEVKNTETGETRWVAGQAGDDDKDLGRHIADGDWYEKKS
jgi:hypothetical protein